MMHLAHPPVDEAGLEATCPRCRELVMKPWLLDVDNIARLAKGHLYSDGDREAARVIREIVLHADRFRGAMEDVVGMKAAEL